MLPPVVSTRLVLLRPDDVDIALVLVPNGTLERSVVRRVYPRMIPNAWIDEVA